MSNFKVIVPQATTNLITNPSFETGTTGWAATSSNTIAQSTAQQLYGTYSLLCTYQDSTTMATFSSITLTAAAYIFSAFVFIPTNWDGGAVRLGISGFTSAATNTATTTTTTTGSWQRLQMKFTPDAGDLTGALIIDTASAPTAGRTLYIDGAQCELAATVTTYCDGSLDDCTWSATPHASSSSREALSRAGGLIYDFVDDLGLYVEQMAGVGMPPMVNILANRAHLDGAEFQRSITYPRRIKLVTTVTGTSLSDYHADRQNIIEAFRPDAQAGEQPFILQYLGAGDTRELECRYESGLETNMGSGFAETFPINLIANDPFWKQRGNSAATLDVSDELTVDGVMARLDSAWVDLGPPTTASAINTIIEHNGIIYAGGETADMNGIANADYVMQYTIATDTWAAMGTGMNAAVNVLKVGPDGNIYAGGDFTTAGGTAVRGVAMWNGSTWAAIGPPSAGGVVNDISWDRNENLYVAGAFTNWDGTANADYIAYWNGSAWAAMSTGLQGGSGINSMAWDNNYGSPLLYVGGYFTTAGGSNADNFAVWTGTAWEEVGGVGFGSTIYELNYYQGLIYIASAAAHPTQTWNGTAFTNLGQALTDWVYAIDVSPDGTVWVGGKWANGNLYKLVGNTWQKSIDVPSTEVVAISHNADGDIFIGFNGTGTAYVDGSTTVTNTGTAKAYPVITITRAGGTLAKVQNIINNTTGAELFLDYPMIAGETLTIDLRPGRRAVYSSFVDEGQIRNDRIWPIQPGSDVINWFLVPGANDVAVFMDLAGTPTITATIQWRNTYWSVD